MSAEGMSHRGVRGRGSRMLLIGLAAGCMALFGAAAPAMAYSEVKGKAAKEVFKKFVDCPIAAGEYCTYAETLSGEFKLGSKTAPIENPLVLQGGLKSLGTLQEITLPLTPPLYGAEEVSKTPQKLPGGLTGISEGIGGEVSATAELVKGGTVLVAPANLFGVEPAVTLPIKIHLQNELLGENCYIGTDSDPIVLHLTDYKTSPPAGTESISGKKGEEVSINRGRGFELKGNTLVDNTFAVPAATGCGSNVLLEPVVTALVNTDAELPSAAGKNVAILNGNVTNAQSKWVAKYDKKEIKAKEKAAKPAK
jgi:hypothetical protein